MPGPEDTAGLLAQLEAERQTGCLTIESGDGRVCRVFLLMGKIFHAQGPAGEGEAALANANSWLDVTLSFDEKAELPNQQTITTSGFSDVADVTGSSDRTSAAIIPSVAGNRRVTGAELSYIGAGCLFALAVLVAIVVAVIDAYFHVRQDNVLAAVIVLIFVTGLLWLVLYFRYRFTFREAAVEVPGGLAKADIPRVIDAAPGVISGEPELVVSMPTRYLAGRLGKCRIEFYRAGLQIWKGPSHPAPRWQFSYEDLLQAESVAIEASGARNSRDQYSLRLIASRPRIAFLFGNAFTDRDTQLMLEQLRKHGVRTFTED